MDRAVSQLVRERARQRCEYCHQPQEFSALSFHIEHVVARQHGGLDDSANLALACPDCNFRKGTNLTGLDPDTSEVTRLYHPRNELWDEHFLRCGARIEGKTAVGRTTVWLLEMNSRDRLRWRDVLIRLGLFD